MKLTTNSFKILNCNKFVERKRKTKMLKNIKSKDLAIQKDISAVELYTTVKSIKYLFFNNSKTKLHDIFQICC